MTSRRVERMMMLSLHGYVSAHAELGLPDTGGQVVYVLELDRLAAPDVYRSPAAFADGVLDGIRHWSGRAEMAPAFATSRTS